MESYGLQSLDYKNQLGLSMSPAVFQRQNSVTCVLLAVLLGLGTYWQLGIDLATHTPLPLGTLAISGEIFILGMCCWYLVGQVQG